MIKISATVKVIQREKIECPEDGFHRAGKDGFIKGCHALMFDGKPIFKGSCNFFWPLSKDEGLRVAFSFKDLKPLKEKLVKRDYKLLKKCYKYGISPKPMGMEVVCLDLDYKHKNKHIKCFSNAIRVERVRYPEQTMNDYANGKPYVFTEDVHPEHSPEGYNRFLDKVKPIVKKIGVQNSLKIGDVLFDTKKKVWLIVDTGV